MQIFRESWQERAKAKRAEIRSRIPRDWKLDQADIDIAKKQRKLSGAFFEKLLSDSDLDIISNDSVQLVAKIKSKQYTAVQVTQTYCKATAFAQQFVSEYRLSGLPRFLFPLYS